MSLAETAPAEDIPADYEKMRDVLPPFIQELIDMPPSVERTEVVNKLVPFCLDPGVSNSREMFFDTPEGVIHEEVQGASFLNRTALVTYIENHYQGPEDAAGRLGIHFMDIAGFREADRVGRSDTDKSADIVINNVALKVNERVEVVNALMAEQGRKGTVVAGRYGGDEIALLLNDVDEDIKGKILEYITNDEDGVCSVEGYFLRSGEPVREKVKLKEGISEIVIPSDPEKAEVWWKQMHKGLLLEESEVDAIISHGSPSDVRTYSLEGKGDEEISTIYLHLIMKHPELYDIFETVSEADWPDHSKQEMMRGMAEFVYENLYDRLLGHRVTNIGDFARHFIEQPYEKIIVIDVKGLKEINDNISMAVADNAIYDAWSQVDQTLPKYVQGVEVFRKGSTFLICETEKSNLLDDEREALLDIKGASTQYGDVEAEFDVAAHTFQIPRSVSAVSTGEVKKILNDVFRETDLSWYKRVLLENAENPEHFQKREDLGKARIQEEQLNISAPENFYPLYFHGKRKEERFSQLFRALDSLLEDNSLAEGKMAQLRSLESVLLSDEDLVKASGRLTALAG